MLRMSKFRYLFAVMAILILVACVCGCDRSGVNDPDVSPSVVPTESIAPSPTESGSAVVDTDGGIAVVGKIERAEDGTFILAIEDDVTINYKYSTQEPPYEYKNCKSIALFDQSEDGVYKEVYQGKTVTIKGILSCFPDPENLRIFIYEISVGRTVERACFARMNSDAQQKPREEYDPEIDLPSECAPRTNNYVYIWNPYAIGVETLMDMGNGFADFYIDFVDAYLSYETSCPCPEKYYADLLDTYMPQEFPLFTDECIYNAKHYDSSANMIYWGYTTTEEEHNARIAEFESTINGYLSNVYENESEVVKAGKLYRRFSTNMTYNYEDVETQNRIDAYYAFSEKTGICSTFTRAYGYLLKMVGIESLYTHCSIADGTSHAWNTVRIDGRYYFCDTTYENGRNGGTDYGFFGMTIADRNSDGTAWEGDMLVGQYTNLPLSHFDFSSERLSTAALD